MAEAAAIPAGSHSLAAPTGASPTDPPCHWMLLAWWVRRAATLHEGLAFWRDFCMGPSWLVWGQAGSYGAKLARMGPSWLVSQPRGHHTCHDAAHGYQPTGDGACLGCRCSGQYLPRKTHSGRRTWPRSRTMPYSVNAHTDAQSAGQGVVRTIDCRRVLVADPPGPWRVTLTTLPGSKICIRLGLRISPKAKRPSVPPGKRAVSGLGCRRRPAVMPESSLGQRVGHDRLIAEGMRG